MGDLWYPNNLITAIKMPVTRKPCHNDNNADESRRITYSGEESSPLGLGYAPLYEVGTRMLGKDETMWQVAIKNDVKVWARVPTEMAKGDPDVAPTVPEGPVPYPEPEDKDVPVEVPKAKKTAKKAAAPAADEKKVTKKKTVKIAEEPPALVAPAPEEEPAVEEPEPEPKPKKVTKSKAAAEDKPKPVKKTVKKAAKKEEEEAKAEPEPEPQPKIDQEPEPEEEKPKPAAKKKAAVAKPKKTAKKEDEAEKAEGEAAAKPAKKLTDYNLFVQEQSRLAKQDPEAQNLKGKDMLQYITKKASALWKAMTKEEQAASVAHLKKSN